MNITKMIKAVFFDIDGTLLNKNSKVLESTKKAIREMQSQGILVGLATGRSPIYVQELMENLTLDVAVTYNGQYVISRDRVISAKPFSKQPILHLAEFASANRREMTFGTASEMVGSRLIAFGGSNIARLLHNYVPSSFSKGLKTGFQKVVRSIKTKDYQDNPVLREAIYQVTMVATRGEQSRFEKEFPECTFTRSNSYSVDIIPKGGSKLKGIEYAGKYFGFSIEETMVFGDSLNDIEMIAGAGIGVAMGNAEVEVKAIADFVTQSNEKDGIAIALKNYDLISFNLLPVFYSKDPYFNKVKEFHLKFDENSQEIPKPFSAEQAGYRADFKVEELVEFLYAASDNQPEVFESQIEKLHQAIDKAKRKVEQKQATVEDVLTDEADALIDLLYFTYGSFVLMGVDPHQIFEYVHEANMGKLWDDGKAHYDEVTGKILKPDGWTEKFAPEAKIKSELARQRNLALRE
ncbi:MULTISPECIES: Cof-type HAD-IIB family hydrolase [unclassified Enterococcus]|uniref:Cof-type HAD-IIB family hydrolase n=1 Tax=unclassified Enterococcus TaxID=2608891 RepID=UPI00201B3879|nr:MULTISPECIES: Cof-type HAD-IIB family hydrolase [unclassified Enterococcus]